jgi:hypothetical protein
MNKMLSESLVYCHDFSIGFVVLLRLKKLEETGSTAGELGFRDVENFLTGILDRVRDRVNCGIFEVG